MYSYSEFAQSSKGHCADDMDFGATCQRDYLQKKMCCTAVCNFFRMLGHPTKDFSLLIRFVIMAVNVEEVHYIMILA